jgi:hypothetical protein
MPKHFRVYRYALVVIALLATSCTTPVNIVHDYTGLVTPAKISGTHVMLALDFYNQNNGTKYSEESLIVKQYRGLAESALTKAGYTVTSDAKLSILVTLHGRTPNGIVDNHSPMARNAAVGALTLGIACREMQHTADAGGLITIQNGSSSIGEQKIDLHGEDTSCFSMMNPNWLVEHEEAALKMYQEAATKHIGNWLPILAAAAP